MKKICLMALSLVLVAVLAVGGTLAYLTDKDAEVNTMTLGNVDIDQLEKEWNEDESGLVGFNQDKPLYPAVGVPGEGWENETADDGAYRRFAGENAVDKYVSVKNTGNNDAYVRTIIALEMGDLSFAELADAISVSTNSKTGSEFPGLHWIWTDDAVATINGQNYNYMVAVYDEALVKDAETIPSLLQVYMKSAATNETCERIDGNNNGKYDILVLSQAVQAEGFAGPEEALDEAFGDVTKEKIAEWFGDVLPKVNVEGSDAAALAAAIEETPAGGTVVLTDDIDFGTSTFTVEKAVVIDLNGKTVESTAHNGVFYLKGGASLKNGEVVHNGTVAGIKVWDAASIENVTVELAGKSSAGNAITGISVQKGTSRLGSLKNVTVVATGDNVVYNGIETYNCGERTDYAIGSMENVKVDVNGTALMLSAPVGTATNCEFKGDVCGINAHLKGKYNVSLKLVDSAVEGGIKAWDEPAYENPGSLKLEGVNTTVVGGVVSQPSEAFGDRWSVTGLN